MWPQACRGPLTSRRGTELCHASEPVQPCLLPALSCSISCTAADPAGQWGDRSRLAAVLLVLLQKLASENLPLVRRTCASREVYAHYDRKKTQQVS